LVRELSIPILPRFPPLHFISRFMAPKRRSVAPAATGKKGGAFALMGGKGDPAHLTRRERQEAEWQVSVPFFPEGLNEIGTGKLVGIAASSRKEHGAHYSFRQGQPSAAAFRETCGSSPAFWRQV
jgi:hypothetical protein